MSNPYFTFDDPAITNAIVDAVLYNRTMADISTAFSFFPPPVQFYSGSLDYAEDTGSPNHHAGYLIYGSPPDAYIAGEMIALRVSPANTGFSTLDMNGRGSRPIAMDGAFETIAGDLKDKGIYTFVFDGDKFQCMEMSTRYVTDATFSVNRANSALAASQSSKTAAGLSQDSALASAGLAIQRSTAAQAIPSSASFSSDVIQAVLSIELFPGCVEIFSVGINPNSVFPGTTWVLAPDVDIMLSNIILDPNTRCWRRSA